MAPCSPLQQLQGQAPRLWGSAHSPCPVRALDTRDRPPPVVRVGHLHGAPGARLDDATAVVVHQVGDVQEPEREHVVAALVRALDQLRDRYGGFVPDRVGSRPSVAWDSVSATRVADHALPAPSGDRHPTPVGRRRVRPVWAELVVKTRPPSGDVGGVSRRQSPGASSVGVWRCNREGLLCRAHQSRTRSRWSRRCAYGWRASPRPNTAPPSGSPTDWPLTARPSLSPGQPPRRRAARTSDRCLSRHVLAGARAPSRSAHRVPEDTNAGDRRGAESTAGTEVLRGGASPGRRARRLQ